MVCWTCSPAFLFSFSISFSCLILYLKYFLCPDSRACYEFLCDRVQSWQGFASFWSCVIVCGTSNLELYLMVPYWHAGAAVKPATNSYVPTAYAGPVRQTANGAVAPVTPLTGYRPAGGAAYRLPYYSTSAYSYTRNRPLLHTCARIPHTLAQSVIFLHFCGVAASACACLHKVHYRRACKSHSMVICFDAVLKCP